MNGTDHSPQVASVVFSFCLSVIAIFFAKRAGFFRLPAQERSSWPTFSQMLGAFLVYLLVSFILVPIIYFAVMHFKLGLGIKQIAHTSTTAKAWLQLGSLATLFLAFIGYCALISRKAVRSIFWGNEKNPSLKRVLKDAGMGVLAWFISYPLVILASLLAGFLSIWIWGKSGVEQVAVKQLVETKSQPALFVTMIFAVIFFVPFIEELLFRGFLQGWLRRKTGRWMAIFLTALIFACVHYAASQGTGNLELIVSLFVLACFLGFIYERQHSLWASMGLHFAFNSFSILFLALK